MDDVLRDEPVFKCEESCSQCGETPPQCTCSASADPWIGKLLDDRYEILSLIDSGGMSHVYRARHKSLKTIRAVKLLKTDSLNQTILKRFEKEAMAVSSLVHPNLVSCVDFGITDGTPYVVMDYIEGKTLAQMISSGLIFEPERIAELMLQVCSGLSFVHKASIFHRDIKPSNIILATDTDGKETVKVLDFGIAKIQDLSEEGQKLTRTGEICGSPVYMSPEQGRGMAVDERTDVYSMGCVMFELLTGRPPFVGNNAIETIMMHINDVPKLGLMKGGQRVPAALESVVMRCLEKDVEGRYRSVEELARDLESIVKGNTLVGLQVGRALNSNRLKRIHYGLLAVIMLGWVFYAVWSYSFDNWRADLAKADSLYYDIDSAEKYLHDALRKLPADDLVERNRASIYLSLARLYFSRNRIEESRQYFDRSYEAAQAYQGTRKGKILSTSLPLVADAYQGMSACDLSLGNLKKAEEEASLAVKAREKSLAVSFYNRIAESGLLAGSYEALGDVQFRMERNEAALKSYRAAEAIETSEQDKLHLSTTLEKEGIINVKLGEPDKALALYRRAMSIRTSVLEPGRKNPAIIELQGRIDALEASLRRHKG